MSNIVKEIINSGSFPPILCLFGEEDFLVQEAATALFEAASSSDTTGMNSDVIDADSTRLDQVLSIARSYPMMSEKRVVWLKHAEKLTAAKPKKGADLMEQYLSDPPSSTFLLITASLPKVAGLSVAKSKSETSFKRKLSGAKYPLNLILEKSAWGEFPRMSESQLASWLVHNAKKRGKVLSATSAQFLVLRSSGSVRELNLELNKLIDYCAGRDEITETDIVEVSGSTREYNVFELQRAIGNGNTAAAVTIALKMLNADRQEMLIVAMLSRYFQQLYRLIDVANERNSSTIASTVGIPPFVVGDYLNALKTLGPRRVERGLSELRIAESTMKSTSTDARLVVEKMLVNILG